MKTKIFAAAAFATLATIAALGSASAADLPMPAPVYKAPPPPPVYNWTGCYIAGGGGYGMWTQDSFVRRTATGTPISGSLTDGGKGWFGMGQAGCDYEFTLPLFSGWSPRLVIGAFGDWDGGNLRGTSSTPLLVGQEQQRDAWFAGGRVGYVVTPRFLTYTDGGWTQARFNQVNYNAAFAGGGPSGLSLAAQTYNGWFIGSGFEYSFDWLPIPGIFLKTEYRYSQYNSPNGTNVPIISTATGAPTAFSLNSQKAVQMISTELVWRFNWFGGHY
jgi:outer membrane immunogenic protein